MKLNPPYGHPFSPLTQSQPSDRRGVEARPFASAQPLIWYPKQLEVQQPPSMTSVWGTRNCMELLSLFRWGTMMTGCYTTMCFRKPGRACTTSDVMFTTHQTIHEENNLLMFQGAACRHLKVCCFHLLGPKFWQRRWKHWSSHLNPPGPRQRYRCFFYTKGSSSTSWVLRADEKNVNSRPVKDASWWYVMVIKNGSQLMVMVINNNGES